MGNRFEISVVAGDESWAVELINTAVEEIRRIEALFTTYNDSSLTNMVNRSAGISPVEVSPEFFFLF